MPRTKPRLLALLLTLTACATNFSHRGTDSPLTPTSALSSRRAASAFILECEDLPDVRVASDSIWTPGGTLAEGTALRCTNRVVQIRSGHVHEAWIVTDGDVVVGAYLPVLQRFFPADPPLTPRWTPETPR